VWRIARLKLTKNTDNVHKNSLNEHLAEVWWRACTKTSASVMNRGYISAVCGPKFGRTYIEDPLRFAVIFIIIYYLF